MKDNMTSTCERKKGVDIMTKTKYVSILSASFWKAYWITMRPYLIFVSGAAALVGLAFILEPKIHRLILGFIPLFFSYGLGQALTDCFQMDTDALSSPYRPLVKGIVSPKQVLSVSLIFLAVAVSIVGYLNPVILIFGILAVVGLLTYTILKRTWWGGPPWNSWIVALIPIMGRLVDRDFDVGSMVRLEDPYSLAFFLAVVAIFFGYANFVVMGYFKDISADRKTGYRTFPVVFGWLPAAVYSDITALLVAFLTGGAIYSIGISRSFNILAIPVFIIAVAINLYAQIKIHLTRDENKTHGPIANVVRAFVLHCVAIVLALKGDWVIFVVIFYLLFELTLKFRPEKTQV
jgi:4-hydroxybenzoate polyprenyltransferase